MICLKKYNWSHIESVSTAGFAWLDETFFSDQDFAAFLQDNIADFAQFKKLALQLNGQFSIVVEKENEMWAFCSHTWSFPLFYKNANHDCVISDQPENLLNNEEKPEPDAFATSYFLQFGVTPFNRTLYKFINQVRPGELVVFKKNTHKIVSLFITGLNQNSAGTKSTAEIAKHLTTVFDRYYDQIKDQQVLLPLTRGYDSRLIACLLAESGHKNVLCATWGRANNSERSTAERVAKQLGFNYLFIEYNEALIKNFQGNPKFSDYVKYAAHWSSMPYLQDYFAVKYLYENKLLRQDAVALPGHPGDFLRGAHFKGPIWDMEKWELGKTITAEFGTSYPSNKKFKTNLQKYLDQKLFEESHLTPGAAYETWDFQERQCKFIGNSNLVYTFFGINVLMPLFDKQNLLFFNGIDARNKNRERLYNTTLEDHFFKKHKVNFDLKQISDKDNSRLQVPKEWLKKVVPHQLKITYYPMNDDVFYREITGQLKQNIKMKHPLKSHSFNAYIVQWYLHFIASQSK